MHPSFTSVLPAFSQYACKAAIIFYNRLVSVVTWKNRQSVFRQIQLFRFFRYLPDNPVSLLNNIVVKSSFRCTWKFFCFITSHGYNTFHIVATGNSRIIFKFLLQRWKPVVVLQMPFSDFLSCRQTRSVRFLFITEIACDVLFYYIVSYLIYEFSHIKIKCIWQKNIGIFL